MQCLRVSSSGTSRWTAQTGLQWTRVRLRHLRGSFVCSGSGQRGLLQMFQATARSTLQLAPEGPGPWGHSHSHVPAESPTCQGPWSQQSLTLGRTHAGGLPLAAPVDPPHRWRLGWWGWYSWTAQQGVQGKPCLTPKPTNRASTCLSPWKPAGGGYLCSSLGTYMAYYRADLMGLRRAQPGQPLRSPSQGPARVLCQRLLLVFENRKSREGNAQAELHQAVGGADAGGHPEPGCGT